MSDLYPRSGYTGSNLENTWHEQEILSPLQVLKQAQRQPKCKRSARKKYPLHRSILHNIFFYFYLDGDGFVGC